MPIIPTCRAAGLEAATGAVLWENWLKLAEGGTTLTDLREQWDGFKTEQDKSW